MASSLLSIGGQSVLANSTALSYVGQNIANVNTDGYSRQTTSFESRGGSSMGVAIQDVNRIADQYLNSQLWGDNAAFSASDEMNDKMTTIDDLLSSDTSSLSSALDTFFEEVQGGVQDPTSIANRQLFLNQANALAGSFNNMYARLQDQKESMSDEVAGLVSNVNSVAGSIGELNVQIQEQRSAGQNVNELMDQRDEMVKELSSYVNIDVNTDRSGNYSITIGNGQPLVVSGSVSTLQIREGSEDPNEFEVYLNTGSQSSTDMTDQITGGSIGGALQYREEVLNPAINEIGRLAIVFTQTMNEQHRKGMDLNGEMGVDLFTTQNQGLAFPSDNNRISLNASVDFYDINSLTTSDYQFKMTGDDTFSITRLSDGQVFKSADMTAVDTSSMTPDQLEDYNRDRSNTFEINPDRSLDVSIDGFTLHLSDTPAINDIVRVEPTRNGARNMEVSLTDPEMLALASPLNVTPATTNTGTVNMSDLTINTVSESSRLRQGTEPTYQIAFNADDTFSVYTVDANGNRALALDDTDTPLFDHAAYDALGTNIDLGDFTVRLKDQPAPGDKFTITMNDGSVGDNTNALALAGLQQEETVNGYSYQDAYNQMLAWVGTTANSTRLLNSANEASFNNSENAVQSVSGVSLDEEATKLVQFQQAYSASAQLISTSQRTFDMLIGAME